MECSEPGLLRDEELLAYLTGERVRPVVEQHLARCPYCSAQLADLRRLEFSLLSKLYRWDCPPNQVLGEFHMGLLDPEVALAVRFHLRACVSCVAELNMLGEFLSGDLVRVETPFPAPQPAQNNHRVHEVGPVLDRLRNLADTTARKIIAALQPQLPRLAYQRDAAPAELWPRHYTAEDFSISLQVERETGHADSLQLIGFVSRKDTDLEALQGIPVLLSSATGTVSIQKLDELGNFVFSLLVPATYTLELQAPESTVVIEQISIDAQDK